MRLKACAITLMSFGPLTSARTLASPRSARAIAFDSWVIGCVRRAASRRIAIRKTSAKKNETAMLVRKTSVIMRDKVALLCTTRT